MGTNNKKQVNQANLILSILVFGTGLILFLRFHVGVGALRHEWLGATKNTWLFIHQVTAIGFVIGFVLHLATHAKYFKMIAERWRHKLSRKIKSKSRVQILFLILTVIVLGAGFIPWIEMPGATLANDQYHGWIDIHCRLGLVLLFGLLVHMLKRPSGIFTPKTDPIHFAGTMPAERDALIKNGESRPRRRHFTKYVYADTSKCGACWECIGVCKYGVLGKVDFWFHKHVIFKNGDQCVGCRKCIAACPNGALMAIAKLMPGNDTERTRESFGNNRVNSNVA